MRKIFLGLALLACTLFGKTYTDILGRNVEVGSTSKLVFIGPGALRLGVYLGLEDRLVGIEKTENDTSAFSAYRTFLGKEKISALPIIGAGGPGKMPDLEALIARKPDLIVASFVDKNQIELITSKTNIPVLALSYGASYGGSEKQLESIKKSLLLLGEVTGVEARAKELVAFMQTQEKRLLELKIEDKSVYIGGVGYKGAQGITSTEAAYPPFELLGIKNALFKDKETLGHQFVEFEAILKANPDVIFIDMFGKKKFDEELGAKKALFETLNAYKNNKIIDVLNFNFYSTNVENLLIISWQVAHELGALVDVEKEAKAIYGAFYKDGGYELLKKLPYKIAK